MGKRKLNTNQKFSRVGIILMAFVVIIIISAQIISNKEEAQSVVEKEKRIEQSRLDFEKGKKERASRQPVAYTPPKKTTTRPPIVLTSYEPKVGMTQQEVLDSSWSYPDDRTKSTTASGVTEMWSYPEYNFIHFKDGKVVAVKESSY